MRKPRTIDLALIEGMGSPVWKIVFKTTTTRKNHIEHGIAAWNRLKHSGSHTFEEWMQVALSLRIGQEESMRLAEIDRPQGSRYRKIFGEWLREFKFDDINKGDRFLVLQILEHRPEIEKFRASLPFDLYLNLNHPRAVWDRFKASQQQQSQEPPR